MPNRGTLTALKDFLGKVRHHKFIYEFDIEGFFNNVGITDTMRRLKERGMNLMTSELEKILRSCPQNIDTS
jgi:retron-type reverse transcriptase